MRYAWLCLCLWPASSNASEGVLPAQRPEAKKEGSENADQSKVLEAVLRNLLTDNEKKEFVEGYGVKGAKEYALGHNPKLPWPTVFAPCIPGYQIRHLPIEEDGLDPEKPALACIWLEEFKFDPRREKWDKPGEGGSIRLLVNTTRGWKDGGAIGGCTIWYDYRINAGNWEVRFAGAFDP